jgi:hypothetical protein
MLNYLLDEAAEQRAVLRINASTLPWASPAWTTVTAYYWSILSALALTRVSLSELFGFFRTFGDSFQRGLCAGKKEVAGGS